MKLSVRALIATSLVAAAIGVGAAPAVAASGDQDIADAGVIVASDVPATWTSTAADNSSDKQSLALAKRTSGCKDYVKFSVANEAATKAESRDFESGGQQMSNKSYVHKNAAVASKLMDSINDSSVAGCLQTILEKGVKTQLAKNKDIRRQLADVSLTLDATELGDIADDQAAFEGTLTIELKDGSSQDLNLGLVALQVDQVILTYSLSAPPDATEIADAFATAVNNTLARTASAL